MKIGHKHRTHTVSPPLDKNIQSALLRFAADFLESDTFKHGQTKGNEREHPVREFMRQRLPAAFRVDSGEVIDLFGNTSPQADLLVSDRQRNFPLVEGSSVILPVEALLVVVEVKSLLDRGEIKKILQAAKRFKALKPFKQQIVARRQRGKEAGDGSRIFYSVFAYGTDLTEEGWGKKEHDRFSEVSAELGIPLQVVDRVYVANRGLLDIGGEKGFEEQGKSGAGLLQFYVHMLNFLIRENGRRESVPYLEYAGRMAGGWKSFREKPKADASAKEQNKFKSVAVPPRGRAVRSPSGKEKNRYR